MDAWSSAPVSDSGRGGPAWRVPALEQLGTVLCMIQAIITLVCDGDTLEDVRGFVTSARLYGIDDDTLLLDGGHATVDAAPDASIGDTVRSLACFVEDTKELPADSLVEFGSDICVDLVVRRVTDISCGSHIGEMPTNILVETHPLCGTCE